MGVVVGAAVDGSDALKFTHQSNALYCKELRRVYNGGLRLSQLTRLAMSELTVVAILTPLHLQQTGLTLGQTPAPFCRCWCQRAHKSV